MSMNAPRGAAARPDDDDNEPAGVITPAEDDQPTLLGALGRTGGDLVALNTDEVPDYPPPASAEELYAIETRVMDLDRITIFPGGKGPGMSFTDYVLQQDDDAGTHQEDAHRTADRADDPPTALGGEQPAA